MSKQTSVAASLRSNPTLALLIAILAISLSAVVFAVFKIQQNNAEVQRFLKQSDDLRSANYRLVDAMRAAIGGSELSFDEMNETLTDMNQQWAELDSVQNKHVLDALQEPMATVRDVWGRIKLNTETVFKNKETVLIVHDVASRLNQTVPQLQEQYDTILEGLIQSGASASLVAEARAQSWRAERIARNMDKLRAGGDDAQDAAVQFSEDVVMFGRVLHGMQQGDRDLGIERVSAADVVQSLNEVAGLFKFVNDSVSSIANAKEAFAGTRQAADSVLLSDASALLLELSAVSNAASELPDARKWNAAFLGSAGISLFVMIAIAIMQLRAGGSRLHVQESENERNQTAILRLLDELADLADGDLTTTATVSEDFTGAIADSINFTIDQLRVLVSRINDTAVRVSSAAQETQGTALHLAEASDHQAQEIAGASAAVNEMAVTIDQVSANAAESAAVAERSVSIANKGAEVVQNTIQGMDNIRDQIQETSKRIKRLGESSQEIGDIVSLINDIADQTNILALNAAIQASMAGDAGRGFAVVADEVQRLAERSSAATKQIEALVKTIQTDTNEAVASMEQTTAEVVRGARLAQDAGVALEEIENVSTTLAELIQNISNAARQQASSAGHISNTMNVIQEITSQTSAGTNATARAIGHLAEMAVDLRDSVQGFKLPDEVRNAAGSGDTSMMETEDERLSFA
ncbi:MAG TPA: methyl-accepting chemotaxis protein [Pseudomonadales bacterium]|nr:methyl-accepting chemotaxis protein [Pseudomonadales bacterium]